ncbi:MAG: hypothetical protein IPH32_17500 [Bacteroidetes bacterium]|nr:hypothetical protein [Bacteroidota bacterium]
MPSQIVVAVAATFKVGVGVTLTVTLVIFEQPVKVFVPDTLYVVVVAGVTVIVDVFSVVLHVYVSAPVIDNVTVWFEQMVVLLAVAFKVGTLASAVIVTVSVADTHQLTVLVTCTVNTPLPFAIGLLIVVLFKLPVAGAVHT